jgi:nucleotide-binding universal stress UspA family protein
LEWAAREAALREARLVVVHAWHVPANAYGNYPSLFPDPGVYRSAASEKLRQSLAAIDRDAVPLGIEERLVQGNATTALLDAAEDTELIVLGSNRRSGLGQLLLGSTSRDVSREARVPVVIVPAQEMAATA